MTAKEVFSVSCHDVLKIGSKMSEMDVKNRAEQGRNLIHIYYNVYQFVLKLMKRKKYKSKAHLNTPHEKVISVCIEF